MGSDYVIHFSTQAVTSASVTAKGTSSAPYVIAAGRYNTISIANSYVVFDGPVAADSLSLTGGSVLMQMQTGFSGAERLDIQASNIAIDATSKIDVSGKGYPGAYQGGNQSNIGRTIGNTTAGGSSEYSGGGYGGSGGSFNSGTVNAVYGDPLNPNEIGSGGGGNSSYSGGNGGGLIRIKAGTISLDGSIISDGQAGSGYGGGGSGGGGRIAVYYGILELPQGNVVASGAATNSPGGAGTIYLKSTTLGTDHLIVDNRGADTGEGSTLLRSMGSGVVSDVTPDTLTTSGSSWQPGALKGMRFAPDVTQSRYFTVIDNDATSLRIDPAEGDLTQATARGLTFSGVYAFTKVSVLGKGRLTGFDRFAVVDELLLDGSTLVTNSINTDRLTLRNGGLLSQWRTTTGQ